MMCLAQKQQQQQQQQNTRLTSVWWKTNKSLNRTLFNQTKRDRMKIFEEILFFKATNNTFVYCIPAFAFTRVGSTSFSLKLVFDVCIFYFIFVSRLILWTLNHFSVLWLVCGISRKWIDVYFQPWNSPVWITGLKAPANSFSGSVFAAAVQSFFESISGRADK